MRPVILLSVALLLAVGSLPFAAAQESDEIQRVLIRWDFTVAEDILGWGGEHSIAPLELKDGALLVRCTGSDPYFESPLFELETSDFQYVRLQLRSSAAGRSEIFYAPAESQEEARFHGDWRMPFSLGRTDDWMTVRVVPFWKPGQKVFRIRFDPPRDDAVWEIAEVAIVERLASPQPSLPEYEFNSPGDVAAWFPFSDIASMGLEDGAMILRAEGTRPAIVSPICDFNASERQVLTIRARVKGADMAEFWYSSASHAEFKAAARFAFPVVPDGKFHNYNVNLNQARGFMNDIRRIALALLDAGPDTELAIDSIKISDRPSGPAEPVIEKFMIGRSVSFPGEDTPVRCVVSNHGGEKAEVTLALDLPDGAVLKSSSQPWLAVENGPFSIGPFEKRSGEAKVRLPRTETADPVVVVARLKMKREVVSTATASTIVSRKAAPPLDESKPGFQTNDKKDWCLQNENIRLVFPRNAYGYGVVEMYGGGPGNWSKTGVLPSLGRLTYLSENGEDICRDIYADTSTLREVMSSGNDIRLEVGWPDTEGRNWKAEYRFTLEPDARRAQVSCTLSADKPAEILAFSFPEYLVGDGSFGEERDLGFFPGLEYLLPDDRSSGTDFCAAAHADRTVPHPYKVTIPLMATIKDNMATGIMWDPLQKWDGEHVTPSAKFASPNYVTPGANHLMGLFVPSVPEWVKENSLLADEPYKLDAGKTLALSASLFAIQGDDFDSIFHLWLESVGGLPEPPPFPYDTYDPYFQAVLTEYTSVTWEEEEKGWHRALSDPWGASYNSSTALQLYWALKNDIPMSPELRESVQEIFDKATEGKDFIAKGYRHFEGPLQGQVEGYLTRSPAQMSNIRPDGSVPFEPDEEHSILGKRGDSSSGHTANALVSIWESARLSANPKLIEVGMRGLKYLDTQIRPEGAQVWELQLHVPDVLASARIVPCYLAAYELTGDKAHIEKAVTWAYRGLPFIYLWGAPDRPIMPYGSIPVFGCTWYKGGWFGRIVQWNGLEFASALLRLSQYDDSLDWRKIAEGIIISAVQQTRPLDHESYSLKDYVPECGHIGMYPDAYTAATGTDSYHWCLSGNRVLNLLLELLELSPRMKTTVVRLEGDLSTARPADRPQIAHIGSVAYIKEPHYDSSSLRFTAKLQPKGPTHRTFIFGTPEPKRVTVDGKALVRLKDLEDAPEGYSWHNNVLYLKFVQTQVQRKVEVAF